MRHLKFVYLLICLVVAFTPVYTVCASVILNEVAIQPTQTVELMNTDATTSADISSWYIDDSGGTTYFSIPKDTILPPLSCLVFSTDFNFNKSSADTVRLFTNTTIPTSSSAALVDSYAYLKAPESGYSFARSPYGEWSVDASTFGLANDTLFSCLAPPTPTPEPPPTLTPTMTIAPTPTSQVTNAPTTLTLPDYDNIYLSEIHPFPLAGSPEWVELYNGNGEQVTLIDWYMDDGENIGGSPKRFSLTLNAYQYGAIDISSSLFNNTGDTLRLLNAQKIEKQSMEFGKIMQGNSMARASFDDDEYCEQTSSKNAPNMDCVVPTSRPSLTPKSTSSTKNQSVQKPTTPKPQVKKTISSSSYTKNNSVQPTPEGVVLGIADEPSPSPVPYLSGVSASYSVLTIVSLFIRMRNA